MAPPRTAHRHATSGHPNALIGFAISSSCSPSSSHVSWGSDLPKPSLPQSFSSPSMVGHRAIPVTGQPSSSSSRPNQSQPSNSRSTSQIRSYWFTDIFAKEPLSFSIIEPAVQSVITAYVFFGKHSFVGLDPKYVSS